MQTAVTSGSTRKLPERPLQKEFYAGASVCFQIPSIVIEAGSSWSALKLCVEACGTYDGRSAFPRPQRRGRGDSAMAVVVISTFSKSEQEMGVNPWILSL